MREITLSNFKYEKQKKMRMDLFVLMDDFKCAIIENKTKTHEHSNQTKHYYEACRQKYKECDIYPIMLSPSGEKASSDDFKSLSYIELFFLLTQTIEQCPPNRLEVRLVEDFYTELKNQFYTPYNRAFEKAKNFRRKSDK
jgi:hypothetical protein